MAHELHVAYDPVLQRCDAASFDKGIPKFLIFKGQSALAKYSVNLLF